MNRQFFTFGLSGYDNETTIDIKLRKLDKELDLVMLTEHYDESLVLLKKLMCWEFEDIVYQPMKVHKSEQPPITQEMMNIIRKVSAPEVKLYDYFNRTFWKRVERYHGNFEEDLTKFHSVKKDVEKQCERRRSKYCNMLELDANPTRQIVYNEQRRWQRKWQCID
ncbi:galactosylceramide sulfotransferase-like [Glandiceps talaboti]